MRHVHWWVALVLLSLPAGRGLAGDPPVEEILASWAAREKASPSLRVKWSETVDFAKGSANGFGEIKGKKAPVPTPATDLTFAVTGEAKLSGPNVWADRTRVVYSGEDYTFTPLRERSNWLNGNSKVLFPDGTPVGGTHPQAMVFPEVSSLSLADGTLQGLVLIARGGTGGGLWPLDKFKPVADSATDKLEDGTEVRRLSWGVSRYLWLNVWVETREPYLPRRANTSVNGAADVLWQLDMEYADRVPKRWTYTHYHVNRTVWHVRTLTISEWSVSNETLPEKDFAVEFPTGTTIAAREEKGTKISAVASDGSIHPINGRDLSASYEDMMRTVEARVARARFWNRILGSGLVAAVLAAGFFAYRSRAARTSGEPNDIPT